MAVSVKQRVEQVDECYVLTLAELTQAVVPGRNPSIFQRVVDRNLRHYEQRHSWRHTPGVLQQTSVVVEILVSRAAVEENFRRELLVSVAGEYRFELRLVLVESQAPVAPARSAVLHAGSSEKFVPLAPVDHLVADYYGVGRT